MLHIISLFTKKNTKLYFAVLCFMCFLGLNLHSQAQSSKEIEKRFNTAVELIDNKNFNEAEKLLQPLTQALKNNTQQAEATYLMAFSATKLQEWAKASYYCQLFVNQFNNHAFIEQAYLLFAEAELNQNHFNKALSFDIKINSTKNKTQYNNLLSNFLNQNSNKDSIAVFNKLYPEIDLVSKIKKIQDKKNSKTVDTKSKKRIAVILPLSASTIPLNPLTNNDNQYIIDLYNGLKLGFEDALSKEMNIEWCLYYCDKDTFNLKKLLATEDLLNVDALIGPIFNAQSNIASKFAQKQNILYINPLTDNLKLAKGNNTLLFKSSVQTIGEKVADYCFNNHNENKQVLLLYSKNPKDTTLAGIFKRTYTKLGGKIRFSTKTDKFQSLQLTKLYGKDTLATSDWVVAFHDEQMVATNLITALAVRNTNTPVMAPKQWLNFTAIDYEQFAKYNFHFIYPDFIDIQNQEVIKFKADYLKNINIYPTEFAYLGYDLALFASQKVTQSSLPFNYLLGNRNLAPDNKNVQITTFDGGNKLINKSEISAESKQ